MTTATKRRPKVTDDMVTKAAKALHEMYHGGTWDKLARIALEAALKEA
jgi:hypothetical protein